MCCFYQTIVQVFITAKHNSKIIAIVEISEFGNNKKTWNNCQRNVGNISSQTFCEVS